MVYVVPALLFFLFLYLLFKKNREGKASQREVDKLMNQLTMRHAELLTKKRKEKRKAKKEEDEQKRVQAYNWARTQTQNEREIW